MLCGSYWHVKQQLLWRNNPTSTLCYQCPSLLSSLVIVSERFITGTATGLSGDALCFFFFSLVSVCLQNGFSAFDISATFENKKNMMV
jgi:hypothetical protein